MIALGRFECGGFDLALFYDGRRRIFEAKIVDDTRDLHPDLVERMKKMMSEEEVALCTAAAIAGTKLKK